MLYSVVLAGVPGRIVNDVLADLKTHYTDSFVIRAAGAPLRADNMAAYDEKTVGDAIRLAANAVFTKSARPYGFCKNKKAECAIKSAGKNSCGVNPQQTCLLKKPDFLIVLYQEGTKEEELKKGFYFSAVFRRIGRDTYNRKQQTVSAAISAIEDLKRPLGSLKKEILSTNSPLLLPPQNFGMRAVDRLLRKAEMADDVAAESERIRRERFSRQYKGFVGRNDLLFKPASLAGRHGVADLEPDEGLALSHTFRAGCQYPNDFHYDAQRQDGHHLSGSYAFFCRKAGESKPQGQHVNVLVDDCIR